MASIAPAHASVIEIPGIGSGREIGTLSFEGSPIPLHEGDTVASALYRAGIRTLSRSFKYHRRRGLMCGTGDCPNCLIQVDGETGVRSCVREAAPGMEVTRQNAWPSADRDLLALNDTAIAHKLLPVGFYYKTLIKPAWAWPKVEPFIRKVAGLGRVDESDRPRHLEKVYRHPDVVVLGMGPAGLSAALGAADAGATVIVADELRPGARLGAGATRERLESLLAEAAAHPAITLLAEHRAFGLYEGPEVPLIGPDEMVMTQPKAIVVATGAFEQMEIFPGNDLIGVMMGRGAVRLATQHGIRPGANAVVIGGTHETAELVAALQAIGTRIAAVVLPGGLNGSTPTVPAGVRTVIGDVTEAHGRKQLEAVSISFTGGVEKIPCDLLVLAGGFTPQENLLRQGTGLPVWGAGDVVRPAPLEQSCASARETGSQAFRGEPVALPEQGAKSGRCGDAGFACICEDVSVEDVKNAVREGFSSTELLKRYTTITMGPCQGRMCHAQMRTLAERFSPGAAPRVSGVTTARPPARQVMLEEVTSGAYSHVERRTALHDVHLAQGASFLWAGEWKRVADYGSIEAEYRAVRENVGMIDVGTLGKFRISGPDAVEFLERLYPNHIADIQPGRLRYGLMLDEHGVIIDDGTICRLDDESFYVTVTTSGADGLEAALLDWRDTWGMTVHIVNQTAALGAINIAGPKAREVLSTLTDDDITAEAFPYLRQREITVAGIRCLAIRLGFVGEVGWELHHPSSRSIELWAALAEAGATQGIKPFGIQAQRLLRLEKGHIIISQDTDFETTPWRVEMGWAVKLEKPWFIGKRALVRKQSVVTEKLVQYTIEGVGDAPWEGSAVKVGSDLVGRVASSWYSFGLGKAIGLAWVKPECATPGRQLVIGKDNRNATVVTGAFYDPEGAKLRA